MGAHPPASTRPPSGPRPSAQEPRRCPRTPAVHAPVVGCQSQHSIRGFARPVNVSSPEAWSSPWLGGGAPACAVPVGLRSESRACRRAKQGLTNALGDLSTAVGVGPWPLAARAAAAGAARVRGVHRSAGRSGNRSGAALHERNDLHGSAGGGRRGSGPMTRRITPALATGIPRSPRSPACSASELCGELVERLGPGADSHPVTNESMVMRGADTDGIAHKQTQHATDQHVRTL